MADETLMLLATEIRGKTLRLLDGVSDEQAKFAAPGLDNSILWHAGHSLMVVEHLGVMAATGKQPAYPADWFEKFSWVSKPATVKQWPKVAEVSSQLRDQLERLTAAIRGSSEEQLATVVDPKKNRTLRYSVLHGLHDEAGHQGEMHLLKKLLARK